MMRSLYSGVSGLKTHQTKMDVIGNNIANVNTVAYKSNSITFQEVMYQTTQAASGANAVTGTGGTNAKQIGLGVTTGAINTNITTSGATQTTGNPFDLKITGDSFFIVSDGVSNYFTKAGAFYVDGAGNLAMTTTGYNVMGWQPDPTDPTVIKQDTVSSLRILSPENQTAAPEATTYATVSGVVDENTETINGSGYNMNLIFYDALGYKYTAKFSTVKDTTAEDTYNVTLTDIVDAEGKTIVPTGATINDMVSFGTNGTAKLTFDGDTGVFTGIDGDDTILLDFAEDVNGVSIQNFHDITMNFSNLKEYDNSGTSTAAIVPGDTGNQNVGKGKPMGTMTGVSILPSGLIYGTYSNGDTKLLGQIAVANFANASGLEKVGENLYATTLNSGDFDGIGVDITADGGKMSTGVLEMSNVDLSTEFTEMITTQRGFQANSRIITTSDTLLEELINLKR